MTQRVLDPDPWRQLAKQRGLRVVPGWGRLVEARGAVLEGVVDDVSLVVDTCMESSRDRFVLHTRVTGKAVAPADLRLALQTRLPSSSPESRPSRVLDAELDAQFQVNVSDARLALALLGEDLRRSLLAFPQPLALVYGGGEVRVFWEGTEKKVRTLDAGVEIVVQSCKFRRGEGYR